MITEIFLGCLTLIEFLNLVIRIVKLIPTLQNKASAEADLSATQPELTEEMRRRLYS